MSNITGNYCTWCGAPIEETAMTCAACAQDVRDYRESQVVIVETDTPETTIAELLELE